MSADITPFIKDAQAVEKQTGIPASITLAQLILESSGSNAGGLSGLAVNAKNLFGVKGTGSAGSYFAITHEFIDGKNTVVSRGFKKYNTYLESMLDHTRVLSLDRYTSQFKNASTVDDFARGLQKGGYATDPEYANKLINLIKSRNLAQYDSGKYKFIGGVSSVSAAKTAADDPAETTQEISGDRGFFGNMTFNIFHAIFIICVAGVGVLFFMRAFNISAPVMQQTGGSIE